MLQLMHSFTGFSAPTEILTAVRRGEIGAFCLFRYKNVASPTQLRELTQSLHQAAQEGGQLSPLIAIDQEGGQLIAITGGATELPGNMALGATRSPELAASAGRLLGRELLAMGLNMNLTPSLDVNINPDNPVIGIRAFGDDPSLVTELGVAFIGGIQSTGVLAAAKHFPGHGDTANDPHLGLPAVSHSLAHIRDVELKPFVAAIEANVAAVLTAHIMVPALDEHNPATLSPRIMDQLLRRELKFDGLIITDAMDMNAVSHYGADESIIRALQAGVDLILMGHLDNQLALINRMQSLTRSASLRRIEYARRRVPQIRPSLAVVGCAEHQHIAQTIADKSITLVRGDHRLPLCLTADSEIAVITPSPVDLTPADTSSKVRIGLADAIRKRHPRVRAYELPHRALMEDISAIVEAVEQAALVIVGTISVERDASQVQLVHALYQQGKQPIVIALRTPYDLVSFPMVDTYLCAYGIRAVTMEAIARVLFGEIEASGVLPCALPSALLSQ